MAKKTENRHCPGLLLFCADMDRINRYLPPAECWQVAYALRRLLEGLEVDEESMSPLAQFAYSQMSEKVERDQEKYEMICERNRRNARKGHPKPEEASGTQSQQTEKETEKESEKEKETVSERVSETESKRADARGKTEQMTHRGTHAQEASSFLSEKGEEGFVPPDEEAVHRYLTELGESMDVRKFMDYNRSRGWTVGASPMRDWRAAVRNWIARDKQRYTQERTVIAQRYTQREYTEADLSFEDMELFREAEELQRKHREAG